MRSLQQIIRGVLLNIATPEMKLNLVFLEWLRRAAMKFGFIASLSPSLISFCLF